MNERPATHDWLLEMKGISKKFGNVQALDSVDLELRAGEILCLVGDNAAGKSTLMKTLYGTLSPDAGTISFEGRPVALHSPRDAQALGIAMIYQDLALFDNLDVAANLCAGREYTRRVFGIRFLDKKKMRADAERLLATLKVKVKSTDLRVGKMSGGQRQMIACGRAIGYQCKVLIMDEPTAALGVREAGTLLDLIQELRRQGLAIILITHRLPDVLAIGDRVLVLKGGKRQAALRVADCTLDDLVTLIVRGRGGDNGATETASPNPPHLAS